MFAGLCLMQRPLFWCLADLYRQLRQMATPPREKLWRIRKRSQEHGKESSSHLVDGCHETDGEKHDGSKGKAEWHHQLIDSRGGPRRNACMQAPLPA